MRHVRSLYSIAGDGAVLSSRLSMAVRPWRLVLKNYQTARYADIEDTDASGDRSLVALRSVNSGNNKNVIFTSPSSIAFSTSSRSVTGPAQVEGKNSEAATEIAVSANVGAPSGTVIDMHGDTYRCGIASVLISCRCNRDHVGLAVIADYVKKKRAIGIEIAKRKRKVCRKFIENYTPVGMAIAMLAA